MHRTAFQLENDLDQLKQLLVPDPVSIQAFVEAVDGWVADGRSGSFAAWLVRRERLSETAWFEILEVATGAQRLEHPGWPDASALPARLQWLISLGYAIVLGPDGRHWAAGGRLMNVAERKEFEALHSIRWGIVSPCARSAHRSANENAQTLAVDRVASESEASRLIERIIEAEWVRGVPDIHFALNGDRLLVRAKRSGRLHEIGGLCGTAAHDALRLIKRRAGLSTADNALPQEGRLITRLEASPQPLVWRVGCLRTVDGDCLVLRALSGTASAVRIEDLHMETELLQPIRELFAEGGGMLLCTGPTGSGKSTTAACLLRALCPRERKLMTIEDPVENELPEAFQSNVNLTTGWTYPAALRAYLRQDPDVIFIGEIRDAETAELACNASLTGHAVVATLHSSSIPEAIDRLRQWGSAKGLIAETIRIVINQRLETDPVSGLRRMRHTWQTRSLHPLLAVTAGAP